MPFVNYFHIGSIGGQFFHVTQQHLHFIVGVSRIFYLSDM